MKFSGQFFRLISLAYHTMQWVGDGRLTHTDFSCRQLVIMPHSLAVTWRSSDMLLLLLLQSSGTEIIT